MKTEEIHSIVEKHRGDQGALVSIFEDIMVKYNYLPQDALEVVADSTGRSLVDIYGVATFYKSFSMKPRGVHLCSVCLGTACHVRGAPRIAEEFERQLGIKSSQTTPDREFTLETVNCLGACALGPVVVVDGSYFPHVSAGKVKPIIEKTKSRLDKIDTKTDPRVFALEVSCPRCNHTLMDPDFYIDGYPSIRVTVSFGRTHSWLRLSSLYGSFSVEYEHPVPMNTVANLFCPHCHALLIGGSNCLECDTSMVPLFVRGGGMVQICPRRGCKGHMLDLTDTTIGFPVP